MGGHGRARTCCVYPDLCIMAVGCVVTEQILPSAANQHASDTRVKHTPTVLQLENVECGAASLAMILAYHGRHVALAKLRVECGVSRDGTKASNLLRVARSHGLIAKGYRKEPLELARLNLPAVVFWNFNHFVVLEGFKNGRAFLNDPAQGRRIVDADEFDRSFTGVVLVFQPGPDFEKAGQHPSVVGSLKQFFSGLQRSVSLLVLIGLLLVIPGVLLPLLSSRFIDDVLVARYENLVGPLLIGMALCALMRAALAWIQSRYLSHTHARKALDLSSQFFWHTLQLPMEFFTQRSAGEIASRVGLNEGVAHTLSAELSQALLNVLTAVFFLAAMLWYSISLTLVAILAVVCQFFAWKVIAARSSELSQKISVQNGRLASASINGLSNIETVKAAGQDWGLFSRWVGLQTQVVNSSIKAEAIGVTLGQIPSLLGLAANIAILAMGSVRIIHGQMTIGELVAFQTLLASFTMPAHTLFLLNQGVQSLRGDLARLEDVLRYPKEVSQPDNLDANVRKLRGELEINDIQFGYNRNDPPIISGFSMQLSPGRRIALVGGSGSGKSTIARLVVGAYSPWSGEIHFDGKPRNEYSRHIFSASVAIVDQDIFLFHGTIRDNLTLWDSTVSNADLIAACKDACIHDMIVSRSGGYDALVDEGGRNLSGGQRQRLEIARALVRNPRLLILDEATSALDAATELAVESNLKRRGCSCLVIAHRLSTVRDADEIIALHAGQIVERGSHEQLMQIEQGYYKTLVAMGMQ